MLQRYKKDFEYTRDLSEKIKSEMGYADVDNEEEWENYLQDIRRFS
jgi:hypothetical protein